MQPIGMEEYVAQMNYLRRGILRSGNGWVWFTPTLKIYQWWENPWAATR